MDLKQIVVYDVPTGEEKTRNKIIEVLYDYSLYRIQYSVFGGNISKEEVSNMVVELKQLKNIKKCDLRIGMICNHIPEPIIIVSERERKEVKGRKRKEYEYDKSVVVF